MSTLNHQGTAFTFASHFERPHGGFILGTKPFIKEVLQGIKAQDLESQDTSYRKTLRDILNIRHIFLCQFHFGRCEKMAKAFLKYHALP
jgi:hypothetical protein